MKYLENLNDRQKEAVLFTDGPLLIAAGAGAGKTKTITHRIAHLIEKGVPPHAILAVTFTNKAAEEMRQRVRKLLSGAAGDLPAEASVQAGMRERVLSLLPKRGGVPFISTFHALGVRLLREFHQKAGIPRGFSIWDRDDSIRAIKKVLQRLGEEDWKPAVILSAISRQKGDGIDEQAYEPQLHSRFEKTVARVWAEYEGLLKEEEALDFDDLLLRTERLLRKEKSVRDLLQARWRYLTIDEYQDTNKSQYEIARHLAGERKNICVVGDTDQNIYSWRGANMRHLLSFERTFPGAKTILLEQNYRSTRTILSAANSIVEKNVMRTPKNLFTENGTGEPIGFYAARTESDEAWFVCEQSRLLIENGAPPSEIAVLYRENFQSRILEESFLHADIPYTVLGTRFFERKEVKDILSYLRVALNPRAKSDLARIIGVPPRGIGRTTLAKMLEGQALPGAMRKKVEIFENTLAAVSHGVKTLPAADAVRFAFEASGMEKMFEKHPTDSRKSDNAECIENVRELANLAARYDFETPPQGIERLLEDAALMTDQDSLNKEAGGVSLMTVHASKGLEFDAVFITGLEQGLFPEQRDDSDDAEEERRLFYVALTRARKLVFLSSAGERGKWGKREITVPSEFLDDIDQRLISSVDYRTLGRTENPSERIIE